MLTSRELRLAAKAAKPFLPPTLDDKQDKRLPIGVFQHANRFRTNLKQADGTWKLVSFDTADEASSARLESMKL